MPASLTMSCVDGALSSNAPYQVCVNRALWNGDLVVFLPAYSNPAASPQTPSGDVDGISVAAIITGIGYAWATTGFRETGLVVPDTWIAGDLLSLVQIAKTFLSNRVGRIYLTGGSQGGLITTLGVERYPRLSSPVDWQPADRSGATASSCGTSAISGRSSTTTSEPVITTPDWPVWTQAPPTNGRVKPGFWNAATRAAVSKAIQAHPDRTTNLLNVTRAPIDPANPGATRVETAYAILRYSFKGTNDAIAKLLGFPFGDVGRIYSRSSDDATLNSRIRRFTFTASDAALQKLETSGRLSRPLVTMHTTGDPVVPASQQALYRKKTSRSFASWLRHSPSTVSRYGHCSFTAEEVLGAFALLVLKATGQNLVLAEHVLPEPRSQAAFLRAAHEFGAVPTIARR
jgi:hypothetical protein